VSESVETVAGCVDAVVVVAPVVVVSVDVVSVVVVSVDVESVVVVSIDVVSVVVVSVDVESVVDVAVVSVEDEEEVLSVEVGPLDVRVAKPAAPTAPEATSPRVKSPIRPITSRTCCRAR
jgi:hypothetical protein